MEKPRMNHRESSYRRPRYRHSQTDGRRNRHDATDGRQDWTDRRTYQHDRQSSRGFNPGSQECHSSYRLFYWEDWSFVERCSNRELYDRTDKRRREWNYSRERDRTRSEYSERSRERSKSRQKENLGGESKDSRSTQYTIFPELWSTHMTEGDYLQLAQWEAETIETETRSKAQSEIVKVSQSLPQKSCRKRPSETATKSDEGPPPPKRQAIYVNRNFVRVGKFYGQSCYWNWRY